MPLRNRLSRVKLARPTLAFALLLSPAIGLAAVPPAEDAVAEQVEVQCMTYGQELGQNGKALASSAQSCVAQERPDLAVWKTCRTRGREHGDKGVLLRRFVTDCLHSSP